MINEYRTWARNDTHDPILAKLMMDNLLFTFNDPKMETPDNFGLSVAIILI